VITADLTDLASTATAVDWALWGRPETDLDDLVHGPSVSGPLVHTSRAVVSAPGIDGFALVGRTECALTVHPSPTMTDRVPVAGHLLAWERPAHPRSSAPT